MANQFIFNGQAVKLDDVKHQWRSYTAQENLYVRYVESEAWTGVRWRIEDRHGNVLALSMQTYDDEDQARAALLRLRRADFLDIR